MTALCSAIEHHNRELINFLLETEPTLKVDVDRVYYAAMFGHMDLVNEFIEEKDYKRVAYVAARYGQREILLSILDKVKDLGRLVTTAAQNNNFDIVKDVLAAAKERGIGKSDLQIVASEATKRNNLEVLELLTR